MATSFEELANLRGGYIDGYTNHSKETLRKYGDIEIKKLTVVRTPISGALNRLLNILSLGKMKRMKQKHGYNDYFHLYLVATLKNGVKIVAEKNERVNITTKYSLNSKSQTMEAPTMSWARERSIYVPPLTMNRMLANTIHDIGRQNFFQYRALSLNC